MRRCEGTTTNQTRHIFPTACTPANTTQHPRGAFELVQWLLIRRGGVRMGNASPRKKEVALMMPSCVPTLSISHPPYTHNHTRAQGTSSSYSAAMVPQRKSCSGASASPRPSLLFLFLVIALATALRVVPSMASTQRALALEACLEKGFNRETLKCSSCEKLAGAVGEKGKEGGRKGGRKGGRDGNG